MFTPSQYFSRRHLACGCTLLLLGAGFHTALAAQEMAPLPARLADVLYQPSPSTRAETHTLTRDLGKKAPGSTAPSPNGAPSTIHFTANFDGCVAGTSVPPATPSQFTLHNVDGRTPATSVNYVHSAWIVREDFGLNVLDCAIFSTSWYSPAGAANDWAAFPTLEAGPITPTSATRLSWNAVAYDEFYRDGYEVRYSTTGTAVADFLANPVLFSTDGENSSWTSRDVSLGHLAGTPIHLAFRNNSNDKYLLLLDDIVVEEIAQYDPALTHIGLDTSDRYGAVPAWLQLPYNLTASVTNAGEQALSNLVVEAEVVIDGTMVANSGTSAATATLVPAGSINIPVISGVFDQIGIWKVTGLVSADEGDEIEENSVAESLLLHVTDNEITRAEPDQPALSRLGIGAGNGGELGNDFSIPTQALIHSIRYTLDNLDLMPEGNVDGIADFNGLTLEVTLRAWDTLENKPGALLHTASTQVPFDAAIGPIQLEFALPENTVLPPGRYLIAAVEPTDPALTLSVETVAGHYTLGTSWVDWPSNPNGDWINIETFGTSYAHPLRISAVLEVPPDNDIFADSFESK